MRAHLLIAISAGIVLFALPFVSPGADGAARNLAAREFQASTAAAAASLSTRIATIQGSVLSADSIVASGVDLGGLCEAMSRDPQRPYQRLNVLTVSGNLKCTTVPETRDQPDVIRQRAYFQNVLTTGEDQVGGPLVGAFSNRPTLVVAHALRSRGSIFGVVVAAVDVSEVVQPVRPVTRSERIVVMGGDGGRFELGDQEVPALPSSVQDVVSRSLATGAPCPVLIADGTAWTCSPVGRTGLALVAGHPERSVFAVVFDQMERQRYQAIGVVVIAVMAAFAMDFLFLRRIRLAYGHAGLPAMNAGDTAKRDEIDALGDWARTIEETRHRLQTEVDGHERRRLNSERDLLTSIAETVEIRYPFLRNHGDRVGRYARQIGARLGISGDDLEQLEFAARIHDLGKIAIADAIYLKPGRLEPIEASQMQLHATRGGELASRMRTVPAQVAEAVRHHHERWDGTGYPDGLAGTNIPLWSRVISVADAYDAMTEERPYRDRPWTHDEALRILRDGAGFQWDATAVAAFLDVLESGTVQPKPVLMSARRVASDG